MQHQRRETKISLATILFIVLCLPVGAGATEIWSSPTKITMLYPASDGLLFITEYSHPQATCDNGKRFMIAMTNPNYDVLASSLLAAFYSGKTIRMNFVETGPSCAVVVNRFFVS